MAHPRRPRPTDGKLPPRAVVFDLGGVLIRHDPESMLQVFRPGTTIGMWNDWMLQEDIARRFECGDATIEALAHAALGTFGVADSTESSFRLAFAAWVLGPADDAAQLVQSVRPAIARFCLSNCNALHWDRLSHMGVAGWFSRCFLSHELRLCKPDPALFRQVVVASDIEPASLVFLDDNLVNVQAARAEGWQAFHVRGTREARSLLEELDLLSDKESV